MAVEAPDMSHWLFSALINQVVGQTWSLSKSAKISIISSLCFSLDTSGPQIKTVWRTAIASGTASFELLVAPQMA